MAIVSSVATTALHVRLSSCRHGIDNSMGLSYSFGMFLNVTKLSTAIVVKRQGLQIRMLKGAGMKQPPEVVGFGLQRAKGKAKHKLVTLDPAKVEEVQKYELFARKFVEGEPASKWESIGDILLEKGFDLEMALKERRKKLLAAALYQHPSFFMLNAGEELQYGSRKADEETNDIALVDVKGKEPDTSIPALLRADDGVKPPPKRY